MRPGRLPRSLAPIINAHSGEGERERVCVCVCEPDGGRRGRGDSVKGLDAVLREGKGKKGGDAETGRP